MKFSGANLAILSALFIGIAYPITELASRSIGPVQVAAYSSILAAIFLTTLSFFIREKLQLKELILKYPGKSIAITLSRYVFGALTFFYGFTLTSAIRVSFLLRLEPFFVSMLAFIFLKERVSRNQMILIGLLVIGAFLLSTSGNIGVVTETQIGDLLIILSLLFFAYSYIPAKVVMKKINALSVTILPSFIGGILLLIIMPFLSINLLTLNTENIYLLLGYVILFSVIGLYLYFAALKRTAPWIVSSLLSLSAIIGAGASYLWLGQTLNLIQIIGAFIIMIASFLITREASLPLKF